MTLLAVLAAGMLLPELLLPFTELIPRNIVVAGVLFLMSLSLDSHAMWRALSQPGPALLAILVNTALAPVLAWVASQMLEGELAIGLIVAATVPCTLASAAVWTRMAGGNDAVALLVTMVTNLACFLVVPAWLKFLLGETVEFDSLAMMLRLLKVAVLPILAAQLMRRLPIVTTWAGRKKNLISIIAQLGLLSIVLVGAVLSGIGMANVSDGSILTPASVTVMLMAVTGLHVGLFAIGLALSYLAGFEKADQSAVAMAGSQKTLMIGMDVALGFGGLPILPMVAYHAVQLVLDTLLARWLRDRGS